MVLKHITNINSYIVTFDTNGTLGAPGIKTSTIEHTTNGTGNAGQFITADGNGGWSWSQPSQTSGITAINDLSDAKTYNNSIYFGSFAGYSVSDGDYNIAVGVSASYSNTTGSQTIAIGHESLYNNTGSSIIAIGYRSGYNNTFGALNTFIGNSSGLSNTYGIGNVAIGDRALESNQTGSLNTSVGAGSNQYTTASQNTAIGTSALYLNTTGENNVAIGNSAFSGKTSGGSISQSIAIGSLAGANALNNSNCVYIGYNALSSSDTADNEIVIGNSVTGAGSNTVTIGNNNTTEIYIPGLQSSANPGDVLTFDGSKIVLSTSGQAVGVSNSPSFTQLTIGTTGANQAILNLQDITDIGTENVAQIKGFKNKVNGGKIQIFTKDDGGSLAERVLIEQTGMQIKSDSIGLQIKSTDGVTEQGFIYNSLTGTKDFIMEAAVGSSTKGITFRTGSGQSRMRITDTGNIGIGTTNPYAKLEINGGEFRLYNNNTTQTHFNYNNTNENYIRGTNTRIDSPLDVNGDLYIGDRINLKNGISSKNHHVIFSYRGLGLVGSNTQHLIRTINFIDSESDWNSAKILIYFNVINYQFGNPFGSGKAFKSLYWHGTSNDNYQFGSNLAKSDVYGYVDDIHFRMNMISLGQWQLVCLNNNNNPIQISAKVHLIMNGGDII